MNFPPGFWLKCEFPQAQTSFREMLFITDSNLRKHYISPCNFQGNINHSPIILGTYKFPHGNFRTISIFRGKHNSRLDIGNGSKLTTILKVLQGLYWNTPDFIHQIWVTFKLFKSCQLILLEILMWVC